MAMIRWTVEFSVDESWIADGFDLTDERAKEMLNADLRYAYGHELDARVVKAPPARVIASAQGYEGTKEVEKVREDGRLHPAMREPNLKRLLREALAKLDSVAFLIHEGDTDGIKERIEKALGAGVSA